MELKINVFGDYQERHSKPTKFTYTYNEPLTDHNAVLYVDQEVLNFNAAPEGVKTIVRVCENKHFWNQQAVVDFVLANHERFDLILTWEEDLMKLPNAMFCPLSDLTQFNTLPQELPKDAIQVYKKTRLVSAISSIKQMVPGHTTRLQLISSIKGKVDLFGRGIREIPTKLDGLKDYMFSVAIENGVNTNYFTEKLTDCFLTGTIPIYYGCPNIKDFFYHEGIITFSTIQELNSIIDNLTPELYYSKLEAAITNFKLCTNYPKDNDSMYDLYYKKLI